MTGWVVRKFNGLAPRHSPRLLGDDMAQSCANLRLTKGTLTPLRANTAVAPAVALKTGTIQTIHRFGQDVANDTQHWFNWTQDVDVVRGAIFDDTSERTYFTGTGTPRKTDAVLALTGATSLPMASLELGIPAPVGSMTATVAGAASSDTAIPETRVYTCTFVSTWDEESSPGLPSNEVSVAHGQSVNLTLIPDYPSGDYAFKSVRIYRTVTGSTDTSYYFVGETTTPALGFVDTVEPDDLAEEMPTLTFLPPPAGLTGLVAMPGGVMAGFVGKDVYFCEPYKPYAWPVGYSMTVDADIVGLGVFDTTLLVLTKSTPYLISGSEPANYSMIRAELPQACVSKRSIVDVGGGIVYASPDGLFLLGGGVTRNLTEQLFSRIEWQALNPSTIHGYVLDNSYIGFYNGTSGFIFNLQDGSFVPLDWYAQSGYYDPIRDALFLVTGFNSLVRFDSGGNLAMHWKSKVFYSPKPINLGCARVEAASYPVTLKVWGDGVLKHTQTVANKEVFRLPSQYLANLWEFEVSGSVEVYSAGFAEAVEEMAHG